MLVLAESPPIRPAEARGPKRRLFSVKEYARLHREGVIGPDERVELIEGVILRMSPIGGPQIWVVLRLDRIFQSVLYDDGIPVFNQAPLFLHKRCQPQPDLMILRGVVRDWDARVPTAADALLVVEVSETSLQHDLGTKAMLYAKHGIPEYWVFDLAAARVIVHRDPSPAGYRTLLEARPPEIIFPLALPNAGVDLAEVLRGCGKDVAE